jgi:hypothetical protein
MKHGYFVRLVAFLCIGIMISSGTGSLLFAQATPPEKQSLKEVRIAGRVYDYDKDNPLAGVTVRIVNVATGQPREDKTDKDGCYNFNDVENGTYTMTVFYEGNDQAMAKKVLGEFQLPSKITVNRSTEKKILIKTCVSLAEKNQLFLMDDCDLCGKVPIIWWIIPAAAVAAGGVIGRGDEEETSPSRP